MIHPIFTHTPVQSKMAEVENIILSLLEKEIPEGRKALRDGHENLAKVATYCQQKYLESNNRYKGAPDKAKVREETRGVLNETKQFATQSLASVAYQINTLAVNMLNLLDQQTFQLQNMESNINHISEIVSIHKEKVARREIGVLATSKNATRTHKIIAPAKQEKAERYARKPIDYGILDDVGHGVKLSQSERRQSSRSSSKKKQPSPSGSAQPSSIRNKPATRGNIKPPPPPVPPPMPPSLPSGADTYESIMTKEQDVPPPPSVQSSTVVAPSKVVVQPPAPPPPPPMGGGGNSPPPPPPFPASANLPPPVDHSGETYEAVDDMMSPPPPPPPPEDFYSSPSSLPMPLPPEDWYDTAPPINSPQMPPPPPLPQMMEGNIPDEYLEKVIALYDYTAMREDELTFTENTIIYVVKKNDDGWFEGVTEGSGQSGLFPGNYVEPA